MRPDREQIRRLATEVAEELGLESQFIDELEWPATARVDASRWHLPQEIAGEPFRAFTETGPAWVRGTPGSRAVLRELGLGPRDVTVHGSFPVDLNHEPYVGIMAYEARFADPQRALIAFQRIFSAPDTVWQDTALGPMQVVRGTSREMGPMGTMYLWIDSGALYQIVCPDRTYAAVVANSLIPVEKERNS